MEKDYRELRKNLRKDGSAFPKARIALLAEQAAQYPAQALRAVAYEYGIDVEIYEAPFDSIEYETLDESSGLYAFGPDIVVMLPDAGRLARRYYDSPDDARSGYAAAEAERLLAAAYRATAGARAHTCLCNVIERDDGLYGSYAAAYPLSLLSVLRGFNRALAEGVAARAGIGLVDIAALAAERGIASALDDRSLYLSSAPFSQEFLYAAMDRVMSHVAALRGSVRKCLVTDLDDTIWGGAVGDVGVDGIRLGDFGIGRAYSDLQAWIRELARRGIAVCVCSKNDGKTAREPFLIHPDMKLSLDDIAVFKANWLDKPRNIREIKETLNIGYDSMVFIDDNPAERGAVRSALPEVTVPELPADATQVLSYLQSLNLFETVSLSGEDAQRTEMYREAGRREAARDAAESLDAYLRDLGMKCSVRPFDGFSIPRVAQLTQRTNQFNLRTVRYSESDIAEIAADPSCVTMALSLFDAYGDYGIIAAAILRDEAPGTLFLDTWLMSCRAASRGVEEFFFNKLVAAAAGRGYALITAEYNPTEKNGPVRELLPKMGFEPVAGEGGDGSGNGGSDGVAGRMVLRVEEYKPKPTYVEEA